MLEFLRSEIDPLLAEYEIKLHQIKTKEDYEAFMEYADTVLSSPNLTPHQRESIRKMNGSLAMMSFNKDRQ